MQNVIVIIMVFCYFLKSLLYVHIDSVFIKPIGHTQFQNFNQSKYFVISDKQTVFNFSGGSSPLCMFSHLVGKCTYRDREHTSWLHTPPPDHNGNLLLSY